LEVKGVFQKGKTSEAYEVRKALKGVRAVSGVAFEEAEALHTVVVPWLRCPCSE
jgi:hypothetical protein